MVLGDGGLAETIPAEFNKALIHKKGALAAARQSDEVNPEKRSSVSQFYIVQGQSYQASDLQAIVQRKNQMNPGKDYSYVPEQVKEYTALGGTPHLDGDYTVFGEVVEGMDVIDRVTATSPHPPPTSTASSATSPTNSVATPPKTISTRT